MKLVKNWKDCWRWFSVQMAAGIVALPITLALVPEYLQPDLSNTAKLLVVSALGLAVIIGRIIKQGDDNDPDLAE